jgi:Cu/Ag efflux protein CusF
MNAFGEGGSMNLKRSSTAAVLIGVVVVSPAAADWRAPAAPGTPVILAQDTQTQPADTVTGEGVVVAADPDTSKFGAATLTVDHEDIPGYMPAMEMMYSVRSPALVEDLQAGQRIRFTIDTFETVITEIEVIGQE